MISKGLELNAFRAPTDNDKQVDGDWYQKGLYIITYLFYQLLSPSNLPAISLQSVVEYPN